MVRGARGRDVDAPSEGRPGSRPALARAVRWVTPAARAGRAATGTRTVTATTGRWQSQATTSPPWAAAAARAAGSGAPGPCLACAAASAAASAASCARPAASSTLPADAPTTTTTRATTTVTASIVTAAAPACAPRLQGRDRGGVDLVAARRAGRRPGPPAPSRRPPLTVDTSRRHPAPRCAPRECALPGVAGQRDRPRGRTGGPGHGQLVDHHRGGAQHRRQYQGHQRQRQDGLQRDDAVLAPHVRHRPGHGPGAGSR